jgi:hypothetical protein
MEYRKRGNPDFEDFLFLCGKGSEDEEGSEGSGKGSQD